MIMTAIRHDVRVARDRIRYGRALLDRPPNSSSPDDEGRDSIADHSPPALPRTAGPGSSSNQSTLPSPCSNSEFPFLFPASAIYAHAVRPNEHNARSGHSVNRDLEDFVSWGNRTFRNSDGTPPIPPDPTKHLHGTRYRRTLAYFIVRRPRGLIAAALQFGHINTKVTLSYAGRADTSWLDDLAVERLEMVLEQNDDDAARLAGGEHVSGPSAEEYRARVARSARFAGRVVTSVRNVERLLNQVDPNIHHGEGMTCVWRRETAACRHAKLEAGLPASDGPDESECRSGCLNLAYTERNIEQQRTWLHRWTTTAADPLVPRPLRDRAAALGAQAQAIIERHNQERASRQVPDEERRHAPQAP
jgi:hypothetical protein